MVAKSTFNNFLFNFNSFKTNFLNYNENSLNNIILNWNLKMYYIKNVRDLRTKIFNFK